MRRLTRLTLAVALAAALAPASALAASRFYINGRGFGHGIGMSQYGAYGLAKHGVAVQDILALYYHGTKLATVDPASTVNVLLQSTGRASFSGATSAGGRALAAGSTYSAQATGGGVRLYSSSGRRLADFTGHLTITGGAAIRLRGTSLNGITSGSYRGALRLAPSGGGGLQVLNVVGVDDYVRGVVAGEMPASWSAAALQAQAIAARTYALTAGGGGFLYPDTRSQVYQGVEGEYKSTNAAVKATRGVVVTYQSKPVITYFFSTSGGRTENVEDSFLGASPEPWLVSVRDPYDSISPRHKWGPYSMSMSAAGAKLSGLVHGSFRGITVAKRGHSPRIVRAYVLGTSGRTKVTGATLRARFGLYDTWAYFTRVSAHRAATKPAPAPSPPSRTGGASGPSLFAATAWPRLPAREAIAGSVSPGRRGTRFTLQRRAGGHWVTTGHGRLRRGGAWRAYVGAKGSYRIVVAGLASPAVRVG